MLTQTATYHVLPVGAVWKVGLPGNSQPSSFHVTREDAVEHAQQLARRHAEGHVVIHKSDGTVESERTFGIGPRVKS